MSFLQSEPEQHALGRMEADLVTIKQGQADDRILLNVLHENQIRVMKTLELLHTPETCPAATSITELRADVAGMKEWKARIIGAFTILASLWVLIAGLIGVCWRAIWTHLAGVVHRGGK